MVIKNANNGLVKIDVNIKKFLPGRTYLVEYWDGLFRHMPIWRWLLVVVDHQSDLHSRHKHAHSAKQEQESREHDKSKRPREVVLVGIFYPLSVNH